jgi:hypothetical protein
MATSIFFNGKQIKVPGVYSTVKSGIKNPALNLAYGNALVIDTGGFGFGHGGGYDNAAIRCYIQISNFSNDWKKSGALRHQLAVFQNPLNNARADRTEAKNTYFNLFHKIP